MYCSHFGLKSVTCRFTKERTAELGNQICNSFDNNATYYITSRII